MLNKPVWLDEQPEILALLNNFIDKLEKQPLEQRRHVPSISVNKKLLPGLFVLGEHADQTWSLIKSLEHEYKILSIRLDKKRDPFDPEYFNARLRLQADAEQTIRGWLRRPQTASPLQVWREAVKQAKRLFPGEVEKLWARPITLHDKSAQQIISAFTKITNYQNRNLTLRQLSAQCFWGRSKFLDSRRDLIYSLYPDLALTLRPTVVNIYLPDKIDGVLFVENQDSYTSAMQGFPQDTENMALVYSAGFKSSARRIRQPAGVALHFSGEGLTIHQQIFQQWWYQDLQNNWQIWFWGDLDFAGMNILKTLKQRFPALEAWQPGYQAMLERLHSSDAYCMNPDDKQTQVDPQHTGCDYADNHLLPAIRKSGLFVDQEIVF
jgi:hypothetical protein